MKIRNGFVSNSSSSSFIIAGVKVPKEEAQEIIKKFETLFPFSDECISCNMDEIDWYYDDKTYTKSAIIGKKIIEIGEGDMGTFTIEQANAVIKEAEEKLGKEVKILAFTKFN